ncbi:uncharacterized protein VP01_14354g1, partial [Puccinia sorghi]
LAQDRFQYSGQTISKYVFLLFSLHLFLDPNFLLENLSPSDCVSGHITSNPKVLPFLNNCVGAING